MCSGRRRRRWRWSRGSTRGSPRSSRSARASTTGDRSLPAPPPFAGWCWGDRVFVGIAQCACGDLHLLPRYHDDWRSETQAVVSMLAFMHWLETGGLLMHAEAQEKLGCMPGPCDGGVVHIDCVLCLMKLKSVFCLCSLQWAPGSLVWMLKITLLVSFALCYMLFSLLCELDVIHGIYWSLLLKCFSHGLYNVG